MTDDWLTFWRYPGRGLAFCLVSSVALTFLVGTLLNAAGCTSTTAAQRRDLVIQSALDSGRAACLVLQNDKSIEREPGVDQYCAAVLNGCPK